MREHQGRLSVNIFIGALKMFYEDWNVSNTNLKDVFKERNKHKNHFFVYQ